MKRQRNYKAEYARRIASGLRRGLSRSQARGHPRMYEPSASRVGKLVGDLNRLYHEEGLDRYSSSFGRVNQELRAIIRSGANVEQTAMAIAAALKVDLRYAYAILYGSP